MKYTDTFSIQPNLFNIMVIAVEPSINKFTQEGFQLDTKLKSCRNLFPQFALARKSG